MLYSHRNIILILIVLLSCLVNGDYFKQTTNDENYQIISNNNFHRDDDEDTTNSNSMMSNSGDLKTYSKSVYFDNSFTKNVTTIVDHTAYLNCRVINIGDKTVSWVRHKDINLLTVGRYTYSSDERFIALRNEVTGDWTLQIKYAQRKDSGAYECQVSTTPPMGIIMHLLVVEPNTTIFGGPDLYINRGSTVNLTCLVLQSPKPPETILWKHNNEEINYDSPRGGVSVITEKGETSVSYLLIQRAGRNDSGKYTCVPSNANANTVTVHILNGEYPAAMHSGSWSLQKDEWNPYNDAVQGEQRRGIITITMRKIVFQCSSKPTRILIITIAYLILKMFYRRKVKFSI